MRKLALLLTAAAASASLPTGASAQVVINQTYDLTSGGLTSTSVMSHGTGLGFSPMVSEQFGVGQTLTLNYDFGAFGLSASNVSLIWANIWDWNPALGQTADGSPHSTVWMTGSVSLLDAAGNAAFTSGPMSNSEGAVHVGQIFETSTGPVTFFGVQYTGMLDAMSNGTSRTYNLPGLVLLGSDFTRVDAPIMSAVPEPATWAMMLIGFAGIGYSMRRRRVRYQTLQTA